MANSAYLRDINQFIIPGQFNIQSACGILLLAAGASTRLGKPKQLLTYAGTSLLQHSLDAAIGTGIRPVLVVLGAHADELQKEVNQQGVHMVMNQEWEEGMASSIRCGLKKLLELKPDLKAVIIMVCDQPYVTSTLLHNLVSNYEQVNKPMVASGYAGSVGTPALFDATIFASLLALEGDRGAKKLIIENPDWLSMVDFPLGSIDIDTESDYEQLKSGTTHPDKGISTAG